MIGVERDDLRRGLLGLVFALVAAAGAVWGRRGEYAVVHPYQADSGEANGRRVAGFFCSLAVLGLLASYGAFMHETPWYRFPFSDALAGAWQTTEPEAKARHWERRLACSPPG